jgi:membrane-associated phospholipid phosphatase
MHDKPKPTGIGRRSPVLVALAATATIGAASLSGAAHAATPKASPAAAPANSNVVVEWNHTLLSLVQTPGNQPATIQPTRDFAMMSAAVYDAVNARAGRFRFGLWGHRAFQNAAAAQAAHDTLTPIFPGSAAALDQQLSDDLAAIAPGRARTAGIQAGASAAAAENQARAADGSAVTTPPYQTTGAPGDFRPTPPAFATPVFFHWGAVTPFVLRSGSQYRPAPPPALTSRTYAAAVKQVEILGQDISTVRTPEQTTIANFWAAPIQNYWNAIAEQVSLAHHDSVATAARTFALLDLGLADATISMYDAKYTYRLWRPINAIRLADTDGNPLTQANPNWTPLATTPADPSYPGAHSTLSEAAATVLSAIYGNRESFTVTSPTLANVTRSFDSFHGAVNEAGLSRIYAGVHTSVDDVVGRALGVRIGRYILGHALGHDRNWAPRAGR